MQKPSTISLYDRGGRLYYSFRLNGKRIRRATEFVTGQEVAARQEAVRALLQFEKQAEIEIGGVRPDVTWADAVVRYIKEKQLDGKNSLSNDIGKFRWLETNAPGMGAMLLRRISRHYVNSIINEPLRGQGLKPRTINHYVQLVSHVLRLAATEWETEGGLTWLESAPKLRREKIPKNERVRVRYLTHAEADRLFKELPQHLEAMARFAVATGLRASNITHCQWEWIDLPRKLLIVPGDATKGKLPITVPLSDEAITVIRKQRFKHTTWVFPVKGKPMYQISNTAWVSAKKRAGIENFRWHDLRHTFASWHIQRGTPLHILQELGGWEDPTMVKKYAHLNPEHLRKFVENSTSDAVKTA